MDYNTIMAQKGAANKAAADNDAEGKEATRIAAAKAGKIKWNDEADFLKNSGIGLTADPNDPTNFYDMNGNVVPKALYSHKWTDNENSPSQTIIDSAGNVHGVDSSVDAKDLGGVASIQDYDKQTGEMTNTETPNQVSATANNKVVKNDGVTGEAVNAPTAENKKLNYDNIEDYYRNSMSDAWDSLDNKDKRILLLDQLGTTLKNMSKYRLPMYSAYGKSYEGRDMGDEKSMLQNMMQTSLQKGLERRNSRLDNQLNQQLKIANFPSDLYMRLENAKIDNKTKVDLIHRLKDVKYADAFKAYLVQNPTAGIDAAIRAVDSVIPF